MIDNSGLDYAATSLVLSGEPGASMSDEGVALCVGDGSGDSAECCLPASSDTLDCEETRKSVVNAAGWDPDSFVGCVPVEKAPEGPGDDASERVRRRSLPEELRRLLRELDAELRLDALPAAILAPPAPLLVPTSDRSPDCSWLPRDTSCFTGWLGCPSLPALRRRVTGPTDGLRSCSCAAWSASTSSALLTLASPAADPVRFGVGDCSPAPNAELGVPGATRRSFARGVESRESTVPSCAVPRPGCLLVLAVRVGVAMLDRSETDASSSSRIRAASMRELKRDGP